MNRDREALDDFVSRVVNHYDNNSGSASQLINYDVIHEAISLALPPAGGVEEAVIKVLPLLSGPHEWGYRDPVVGGFVSDNAPFHAAEVLRQALAAVHPRSPTTLGEES